MSSTADWGSFGQEEVDWLHWGVLAAAIGALRSLGREEDNGVDVLGIVFKVVLEGSGLPFDGSRRS